MGRHPHKDNYEFTLIVEGDPTEFADELFELAHGDLVPEGGGDEPGLVHACVDSDSPAESILGAVVKAESLGLVVVGVESENVVSLKDIAARTDRTYESVRLLASGKRGPGGFPAPMSTGQWALYSWVEVSAWLAEHYGGEAVGDYDREIVAADHLIRARHILGDDEHRAKMAKLLTA